VGGGERGGGEKGWGGRGRGERDLVDVEARVKEEQGWEARVKVDRRQGNPPAVRWTRCRWQCHTCMEETIPLVRTRRACKQQGKKGTILVILTHIAVLPESMRRVSCDM